MQSSALNSPFGERQLGRPETWPGYYTAQRTPCTDCGRPHRTARYRSVMRLVAGLRHTTTSGRPSRGRPARGEDNAYFLPTVGCCAVPACDRAGRRRAARIQRSDIQGTRTPRHRAGTDVGTNRRHRHRPNGPEHLVRWRRERWHLENRNGRHDLGADFRQRRHLFDRLHHDRSEQPEHALGRHGRERQRPTRCVRRRRLSQPRRRRYLGKSWPGRLRAHWHDSRRPTRLQHGIRGVPGAAVVRRRRARSLQDHGRRRNLAQGTR